MKNKAIKKQIAKWSAIIGFLLAAIMGFSQTTGSTTAIVLIALGGLVGLVIVQKEGVEELLLATVAFMLLRWAGLEKLQAVGKYMGPILTNISILVAPIALILSFKQMFKVIKA